MASANACVDVMSDSAQQCVLNFRRPSRIIDFLEILKHPLRGDERSFGDIEAAARLDTNELRPGRARPLYISIDQ